MGDVVLAALVAAGATVQDLAPETHQRDGDPVDADVHGDDHVVLPRHDQV